MQNTLKLMLLTAFVAVLMVACEKESPTGNRNNGGGDTNIPSNITVKVGSTYQIGSGQSWISSDEFVATVSNSGNVKGEHVGACTVRCSTGSCRVTVKATINLFRDPITQWGMSKSEVIAREGTPVRENDNTIAYETGYYAAPYLGYSFKNGGLNLVSIITPTSYKNEIINHLKQRYRYIGLDAGIYYFANGTSASNATTIVLYRKYSDTYWAIQYVEYSNNA